MSQRRTVAAEDATTAPKAAAQVRELLTWERVLAWASLQWGAVGVSDHLFACPLARYLNAATGLSDGWSVGIFTVCSRRDRAFSLALPPWATQVLERIDQGTSHRQIDARQFRAILHACKPDIKEESDR